MRKEEERGDGKGYGGRLRKKEEKGDKNDMEAG